MGQARIYDLAQTAAPSSDFQLMIDKSGQAGATRISLAQVRATGFRWGLDLNFVNDDTIQVGEGVALFKNGKVLEITSATNITFTALDTGSRAVGKDYYVFATPDGIVLSEIPQTFPASKTAPQGYTTSDSLLVGYLHNGKDYEGGGTDGAIFEYSICGYPLIHQAFNFSYPYRAHSSLPAGIPLPGMVKVGPLAIGIYQSSREDATASAGGSSNYPTSRYGVVPWSSIQGWSAMMVCRNAGCRLPSWEEWLGAVEFNPGSATPAIMNGNTNSGASSDDATQSGTADPTQSGRCLVGTGPRTTNWGTTATGRSWYSPAGLADPVGNIWEWVATFFAGLKTSSPGSSVDWGYQSDKAWNFEGQAYNPDTGGWTSGLPALLYVGGNWGSGANAGVRAASAHDSPGYSSARLGFRLAR